MVSGGGVAVQPGHSIGKRQVQSSLNPGGISGNHFAKILTGLVGLLRSEEKTAVVVGGDGIVRIGLRHGSEGLRRTSIVRLIVSKSPQFLERLQVGGSILRQFFQHFQGLSEFPNIDVDQCELVSVDRIGTQQVLPLVKFIDGSVIEPSGVLGTDSNSGGHTGLDEKEVDEGQRGADSGLVVRDRDIQGALSLFQESSFDQNQALIKVEFTNPCTGRTQSSIRLPEILSRFESDLRVVQILSNKQRSADRPLGHERAPQTLLGDPGLGQGLDSISQLDL